MQAFSKLTVRVASAGVMALALLPRPSFARQADTPGDGDRSGLRGAEVGKLHDAILQDLLDARVLAPGEPITRARFEATLDASTAFLRLRVDDDALARDLGVGEGAARRWLDLVLESTVPDAMRLLEASNAFVPVDQDPRNDVMRPPLDVLRDAIAELASQGVAGVRFAEAVQDFVTRRNGDDKTAGEFLAEAHREFLGATWDGNDRLAADVAVSIAQQSFHFWSGHGQGFDDGTGGGLVTMGRIGDTAAADAVGGVIGGAQGGVIGGLAGFIVGGPPGLLAGAAAGAAVDGGILGAAFSIAMYMAGGEDQQPPSGGDSSGGSSGGSQGGTNGGDTGGDSGGDTGSDTGGTGGDGSTGGGSTGDGSGSQGGGGTSGSGGSNGGP